VDVSVSWLLASILLLQPEPDSSLFRRHDGTRLLLAAAATVVLSGYDERIATWTRTPRVQGGPAGHDLVSAVTVVNEVPLTLAAMGTYAAGRVARSPVVADVGLHVTESLLAAELVSGIVRISLGRTRPRASPDDAFEFAPGSGLSNFDNRSFPSLHAAVAFATASALVEEMRVRRAPQRRYLGPILYAAAAIPGLTRLYLDQHWASDVLAGSLLGMYVGSRVVRYTHARRTRLDRVLLGARVSPCANGVVLTWSASAMSQ
jgi:membrane-associated phospholipid phosphatase